MAYIVIIASIISFIVGAIFGYVSKTDTKKEKNNNENNVVNLETFDKKLKELVSQWEKLFFIEKEEKKALHHKIIEAHMD